MNYKTEWAFKTRVFIPLLLLLLPLFSIQGALAAGPALNLPTFNITATYSLSNPWPVHVTLSGVGSGYAVQDNVPYNVWCVERLSQTGPADGVHIR